MLGVRLVPLVLLTLALAILPAPAAGPLRPTESLPSSDQTWELLPRQNPPLPVWARAMVGSLPRTTAGMLELDSLHRARNPLGAVLAGKLRWAAADAIGCEYARRNAEADLIRAGGKIPTSPTREGTHRLEPAERAAIAFARKLTVAAYQVTDEEVAELLKLYGAEKLVAIVHTIAFANFQNRVFLALGCRIEPDGPLPPLEVRFDLTREPKQPAPKRPAWPNADKSTNVAGQDVRVDWVDRSYAELEKSLAGQKARKARIPTPGADMLARIPPEARAQASRVVWTAVSMGFQPELTKTWFDTMRAFQTEARLEPVFSTSMFWVITRANECFY